MNDYMTAGVGPAEFIKSLRERTGLIKCNRDGNCPDASYYRTALAHARKEIHRGGKLWTAFFDDRRCFGTGVDLAATFRAISSTGCQVLLRRDECFSCCIRTAMEREEPEKRGYCIDRRDANVGLIDTLYEGGPNSMAGVIQALSSS